MSGVAMTLAGKCVFNDATNLSSPSFFFVDTEAVTFTSGTTVRPYAGGRRRAITLRGYDQSLSLALKNLSRADVNTIEAWARAATFLLYRDTRGRKVWGTITSLSSDEVAGIDMADVTVTFVEVTYDEAV